MAPSLSEFDFGLPDGYPVPLVEPHPDDEIAYTIFHVARALESIEAIGPGATIDPIFQSFPALKVVRPIQPVQRHRYGVLKNLGPKEPHQRHQQAAILLYALLPGEEGHRCSACCSHAGNGPFAKCISGGSRWTSGACLCCYFTGTSARCELAHEHFLSIHRDMREKGELSVSFPAGAEREAASDDLEVWRALICEEQHRRVVKLAMLKKRRTGC